MFEISGATHYYAGQPQARHHNTITIGGQGQGDEGDHDRACQGDRDDDAAHEHIVGVVAVRHERLVEIADEERRVGHGGGAVRAGSADQRGAVRDELGGEHRPGAGMGPGGGGAPPGR